jgi:hypothetical protein
MTDSIQVLKPGWRALDADGVTYSGAVLHFFDAGTSNTRTVYSNYGLSSALGVTVTCDGGGFPTSDGSAKVEVYTGNTPYKVILKDNAANTIWTIDNIIGALDTSDFLTDDDVAPDFPITNTSSAVAPVAGDKGKFWNINCSGGDVTVTFPAATTLGNGWNAKFRHDGTANQVLFLADGSELFKLPSSHAGVSAFAATHRGQVFVVSCDGTGFKVEQTGEALFSTTGVILVADRLSTPASSPEAGQRYIVGAAPTGAWSSFAQHDIAEASGQATWFKITPPTNSGWVAYVQDDLRHYNHDSTNGWRLLVNGQAAVEYLSAGTISAAATLDITIPTDVDEIEILLWNIIPVSDANTLVMRFSQSAAFLSGASDYQWAFTDNGAAGGDNADSEIQLGGSHGTNTNERAYYTIRIFKPNAASTFKGAVWQGGSRQQDGNVYCNSGWGEMIANSNAIDGVRILFTTGNISSGFYAVQGRRYS